MPKRHRRIERTEPKRLVDQLDGPFELPKASDHTAKRGIGLNDRRIQGKGEFILGDGLVGASLKPEYDRLPVVRDGVVRIDGKRSLDERSAPLEVPLGVRAAEIDGGRPILGRQDMQGQGIVGIDGERLLAERETGFVLLAKGPSGRLESGRDALESENPRPRDWLRVSVSGEPPRPAAADATSPLPVA